MGRRQKFLPTPADRTAVTTLVACGSTQKVIARHFGVDVKTLRKQFPTEIREAGSAANSMVAQTLFEKAVGGNLIACIFWLKTRAGWRETSLVQSQMLDSRGRPINAPKLSISWADGGPGLPPSDGAPCANAEERKEWESPAGGDKSLGDERRTEREGDIVKLYERLGA